MDTWHQKRTRNEQDDMVEAMLTKREAQQPKKTKRSRHEYSIVRTRDIFSKAKWLHVSQDSSTK